MREARIDTTDGFYLIFVASEGMVPEITVGQKYNGYHRVSVSPVSARAFAQNILTLLDLPGEGIHVVQRPAFSHGASEPCDICDR